MSKQNYVKEISNKTILTLLLAVAAVSLFGTLFSIQKLGSITGAQISNDTDESGTTSITIQGTAKITLRISTVDFGTGQINDTTGATDYCTITSNVSLTMGGNTFDTFENQTKSVECVGFKDSYSFVLENTGNIKFSNITVNSTNAQAWEPIQSGDSNGIYAFKVHEEGTACADFEGDDGLDFARLFNTTHTSICVNLTADASNDALALQIGLTIPEDAPASSYSDTLIFIGNI